jgi:exopolysaccharide biosynthesis polyprenyl glycosylphosphotransferase
MFYDERLGSTALHAVSAGHAARPQPASVVDGAYAGKAAAQPHFGGPAYQAKAVIDRVVALVGLLVLLPLLLGIAVAVRCSSRGPVLFRQTRVGRHGRTFSIVKFRSMYDGAERRLGELLASNDSAGGVLFKMREDPRVTPVGRFLRRLSFDELPQLLNVLTGSMSLVGPRPPLPAEVARHGESARRRQLVKPGITGLWQVSGRSNLSWEDSIQLDLQYVESWSLALDTAVLLKTVPAVLRAEGAY